MSAEPLERLAHCHRQIETQLEALARLVERSERSEARDIVRFFDTSGALHHEDEDRDFFPLLRSRAAQVGRSEVAAAIDELEREHATMDAQWQRLRGRLAAIAEGSEAALDAEEVERFCWLYRRHMERESQLVIPFAQHTLTPDERLELARRMQARRAPK